MKKDESQKNEIQDQYHNLIKEIEHQIHNLQIRDYQSECENEVQIEKKIENYLSEMSIGRYSSSTVKASPIITH